MRFVTVLTKFPVFTILNSFLSQTYKQYKECMGNIQSARKHVSKFRRRKIVKTAANVVSREFPEKYVHTNDFHPAIFKQITMGTSYFKLYFNISVHSCGFFL